MLLLIESVVLGWACSRVGEWGHWWSLLKIYGEALSIGFRSWPKSDPSSAGAMEDWRIQVHRTIGFSLSPGTRKRYQKAVCQFKSLRRDLGYYPSWPVLVEHVLHYEVFLKVRRLVVSAIWVRSPPPRHLQARHWFSQKIWWTWWTLGLEKCLSVGPARS